MPGPLTRTFTVPVVSGRKGRLAWPAPSRPEDAIDDQEHDLAVLRSLLDETDPAAVRGHAHYLLKLNECLRRSVVDRWARLLAECDAQTSDDLEREGHELRALFGGAEGFARFAKLVTAYQFEEALAALRHAAGERML